MSQKELQDLLGIQAGSMSEIAAKLEDKGLITRVRSEGDRRKVSLSITEQGRVRVAQSDEAHILRRRAELFAVLTPGERCGFQEIAQRAEKLSNGNTSDAVLRVVYTMDELNEKLRVFENGLDDRIVEACKGFALSQFPASEECYAQAVVYDVIGGQEVLKVQCSDGTERDAFAKLQKTEEDLPRHTALHRAGTVPGSCYYILEDEVESFDSIASGSERIFRHSGAGALILLPAMMIRHELHLSFRTTCPAGSSRYPGTSSRSISWRRRTLPPARCGWCPSCTSTWWSSIGR